MSKLAIGAAAVVMLFVAGGFVTLAYPFIHREPLAEPFLEVDDAEGKVRLDSRIVMWPVLLQRRTSSAGGGHGPLEADTVLRCGGTRPA